MPHLSRAQLRQIDQLSFERYHIPTIVLMENAARAAADLAGEILGGSYAAPALILCGGGNNGGDGLAIARHLHNRGMSVHIALATDPARYKGDALINWQIISAMNLPTSPATPALIHNSPARLIIDAIFGTGLTAAPRDPFPQVADAVNAAGRTVLAIDIPSGLDCDTGLPPGSCIRATHTITFAAQKIGFANPAARQWLGQVTVGDIGCPRELIEEIHRRPPTANP